DFDEKLKPELAKKMNVEATELPNGTDANTLTTPGVYYESRSSGAGPNFPEPSAGVFTVTANPPREHVHQQFITFGAANPRQWYRSRYNGTWSPWKQIVTQDMMTEVVDQLRDDVWEPVALGDMDLNTVVDPGIYTQDFSASATVALNYPEEAPRAGRLFVQANTSRTQVNQQYITYDANEYMVWFVRNFYQEWGPWQQVDLGEGGDTPGGGSWDATEIGEASLDDMKSPGVYWQSFSASATEARGYPYPRAGHLIVTANDSGSQVSQRYLTFDATANIRMSVRNFYTSGELCRDIPLDGQGTGGGGSDVLRGTIANGTDINTVTEPGFYSVPTVAVANTLVNWPTNRGGVLIVGANTGTGVTSQDVLAHVSSTAAPERYV